MVGVEPSKRALDNPVLSINAETCFLPARGSVSRLGCRTVRQMLPEDVVKQTVDERHLHLTQQVMGGDHLVTKIDGSRAGGGVGW